MSEFFVAGAILVCSVLHISCDSDQNTAATTRPLPVFSITDIDGDSITRDDFASGVFIVYAPRGRRVNKRIVEAIDLFASLNRELGITNVLLLRESLKEDQPGGWRLYVSPGLDGLLRDVYGNFGVLLLRRGDGLLSLPLRLDDPVNISVRLHDALWGEARPFRAHLESHQPQDYVSGDQLLELVGGEDTPGSQRFFCINDLLQECDGVLIPELLERIHRDDGVNQHIVVGPDVSELDVTALTVNYDFPIMIRKASSRIGEAWNELDRLNYNYLTNFIIELSSDGTTRVSRYISCNALEEYVEK